MRLLPEKSTVLIVGAGPSGLMMAAQLLRNGIHPLIIDLKIRPSQASNMMALQARSLEVLQQLGLDESAINQGEIIKEIHLYRGSDKLFELDFDSLGKQQSPFPFVLLLEQSKTERILVDYLTSNTCPIYWNSELLGLTQNDENVNVVIRQEEKQHILTCEWLIAADGALGKARSLLSVPSIQAEYKQQFYSADFNLDQEVPDTIRCFLSEEGLTGLIPMPNSNLKVTGTLPKTLNEKTNISFADVKPYLTYTLDFPLPSEQCTSFSVSHLHQHIAEKFQVQRCFLIGDSACSHRPPDIAGANSGIQDAYNLAWKLAGVIKGEYQGRLLESYDKERRLIAKQLFKARDRFFSIGISDNWMLRRFRNWILPPTLVYLEKRKTTISAFISQTGLSYRHSRLSIHYSQSKKIKAGDRLPYIRFYDEKLKEETDLHSWCSAIGFTLLVLGNLNERDLFLLAKWIKQTYPFQLNFFYLPPSARNQHVFDRFEIKAGQKRALIVRPDLHIGYLNDAVVIEMIDTYLKETIGWK